MSDLRGEVNVGSGEAPCRVTLSLDSSFLAQEGAIVTASKLRKMET